MQKQFKEGDINKSKKGTMSRVPDTWKLDDGTGGGVHGSRYGEGVGEAGSPCPCLATSLMFRRRRI